jgi:hypothetical protein
MLRYQIKTHPTVHAKIEAAGGDESVAKRILDGLRWRLAHNPDIGTVIDETRNVRQIKSVKQTPKDPVVVLQYRMIQGDEYYDMELMDINIIP